jgi:hypothetical protein
VAVLFVLLELGVLGTVALFDAPPLKPDELLLLAGELLDAPTSGVVDVGFELLFVLGCGGLLLAPPLNPDDGVDCEGVDVLFDDEGTEGDEFGVEENEPDLTEVEGADVDGEVVELLLLGVLEELLLPELVAANDVIGLNESIRAKDNKIIFLFIISDPSVKIVVVINYTRIF